MALKPIFGTGAEANKSIISCTYLNLNKKDRYSFNKC